MADSTCGHVDDRGLAISKWPTPGIRTCRTESPARVAAFTYATVAVSGPAGSSNRNPVGPGVAPAPGGLGVG